MSRMVLHIGQNYTINFTRQDIIEFGRGLMADCCCQGPCMKRLNRMWVTVQFFYWNNHWQSKQSGKSRTVWKTGFEVDWLAIRVSQAEYTVGGVGENREIRLGRVDSTYCAWCAEPWNLYEAPVHFTDNSLSFTWQKAHTEDFFLRYLYRTPDMS